MDRLNQPLTFAFLDDMPEALVMIAEWDYEEWENEPGNSIQKNLERIQAKLNHNNPPQYILVPPEGQLLGFSQLKQWGLKVYPAHSFWLGGTVVSPAFRGYRIGSALVEKVAEVAKQCRQALSEN